FGGIGHCGHSPLDAGFAQQMQHGIRRAIGVVFNVLGLRIGEPVAGVKARDLQLSLQTHLDDRRLADVEKLVVFDEITQDPWMYQQRGFATRGVRCVQGGQFRAQLLQQPGGRTPFADAKAHAVAAVHAFGERAKVEADDGSLQPAPGRRDDFIVRHESTPFEYPNRPPHSPRNSKPMPQSIPATLIPGDGIGPEIMDATLAVLTALGAPFEWDTQAAGLAGVAAAGDPLPAAAIESIRRTRLALKGPLETPSGGGYRSSNVRLREEFKLYANLRPARTLIPGGRFENIDLVVVRENLEGLYIGHELYIPIDDDPHALAMATGVNTRQGSRRLLQFAFEHAIATGRKKVAIVHKANIMKALTGIFLETGLELYERKYKGKFILETIIIDACAMKLVFNPWQFDVLVTTNLFGDILSDLVAGLVGGLGMAPGANIGADAAIFEAVHGSAPDIAGKGIANPIALMLAAAMMLEHCHLPHMAARLRSAIDQTLNVDGIRTGDLGGRAGTAEF